MNGGVGGARFVIPNTDPNLQSKSKSHGVGDNDTEVDVTHSIKNIH